MMKRCAWAGSDPLYIAYHDDEWGVPVRDGRPVQNHWPTLAELPVTTLASEAMSKALKEQGFKFVGSTICCAFMQARGMVNDHTIDCARHRECRALAGGRR